MKGLQLYSRASHVISQRVTHYFSAVVVQSDDSPSSEGIHEEVRGLLFRSGYHDSVTVEDLDVEAPRERSVVYLAHVATMIEHLKQKMNSKMGRGKQKRFLMTKSLGLSFSDMGETMSNL